MGKAFAAAVLVLGLPLLLVVAPSDAPASSTGPKVTVGSLPLEGAEEGTGLAPGVDAVVVPDRATAQRLVGSSDRVESGLVNAYLATYSPEFDAGYYAVTKDQGISSAGVRAQLSKLDSSNSPRPSASSGHQTILVFSHFTRAQIEKSLAQVTASIESSEATAAFYYDPASDSILLGVQMPQAGDQYSPPVTDVPVQVDSKQVSDVYYREDMRAPFRGGGTIYNTSLGRCTSVIPAYNSAGTSGYFTAAHCFALSAWTFSSSSLAGASNTGKVTHRYGTAAVDAEFVSQRTYTGRVYTSADLSVSKPIVGTYYPPAGVGNRLCFSGSTTAVQCGNALITYYGSYCGATGCNDDLLALRGGVATQGGDSGAPLYANFGNTVKVSGIIRGLKDPWIGESTTFAVDWRKIASTYNASLMYG